MANGYRKVAAQKTGQIGHEGASLLNFVTGNIGQAVQSSLR